MIKAIITKSGRKYEVSSQEPYKEIKSIDNFYYILTRYETIITILEDAVESVESEYIA